ncbi:hypothetical protein U1Q18_005952 [Sarracenia purpurea var. burkii]
MDIIEGLELGVSQEGDRNNVSASVLADVDHKVAFWYVDGETLFVVALPGLSQAGAPLENLLQNRFL